jgi:phosphoribosylglycinamide formyltransferase-1
MNAIVEAVNSGQINAEIAAVISNNPQAPGLIIAKSNDIKTKVIERSSYATQEHYEIGLVAYLKEIKVDLIILAGYMRIVGDVMLKNFENKILNIHPSLLPSFKGLHAQKQALDAGVRISGCTVHFVNNSLDGGPIILQEAVPVLKDDDEETLSARILEKEHQIFPKAIDLFLKRKLEIKNNKVLIND